tara:strand:+ start:2422 stop:3075 length:654 start_codon:yes stop_codon:yes gene_type:complete
MAITDKLVSKEEFHSYCEGKSICIIGNSNRTLDEKNRGTGEFVDSHDIVMRMNHVYSNEERAPFIGTKTDVWMMAVNPKLCDELSPRFPDRKYIFTPSWRGFTRRFSIPKKFAHQTYCSGPDFFQEHVNRLIKVWKNDFNGEGRELFTTSSGCKTITYFLEEVPYGSLTLMGVDFFKRPDIGKKRIGNWPKERGRPDVEKYFLKKLFKKAKNFKRIK